MNKLTILLCFLAVSSVFSACNTDYLTYVGLTGSSVAALAANPTYCSNTLPSGANSCCGTAAADFDFVQTDTDAIVDSLEGRAQIRDQSILTSRKALVNANTTIQAIAALIESTTTIVDDDVTNGVTGASTAQTSLTTLSSLIDAVITNYETIQPAFDDYRSERKTCLDALIPIAAASFCIACSDDPTTTFQLDTTTDASNPVLTYDATTQTAIQAACYQYLVESDTQNQIVRLYAYNDVFEDMITALTALSDSAANDYTDLNAAFDGRATDLNTTTIPQGCTSDTACSWLLDTVIPGGVINQDEIIAGGDTATSRRLSQRLLQVAFDASANAAGVTVDFAEKPGDLENNSDLSAFHFGVVSSILAVFAALLF